MKKKLVITGVGRSGTTFLVELLTVLGLDTGFTVKEVLERSSDKYKPKANAGLERKIDEPFYVIKNPLLCDELRHHLSSGDYDIRCIVCTRAIDRAAKSRVSLGHRSGGLWGTKRPEMQRVVLQEKLSRLIHDLAWFNVPTRFIGFPKSTTDSQYVYECLKDFLDGVTELELADAHKLTARPDLVHF